MDTVACRPKPGHPQSPRPGPCLRPPLQQKPSLGRLGAEELGCPSMQLPQDPRTPAGATSVPFISC